MPLMGIGGSVGMVGVTGFVALLSLTSAGLLLWLVMRLSGRVGFLERQTRDLASACRILHQKIDSIPIGPVPIAAPASAIGELRELGPGPDLLPASMRGGVSLDTGMNLSKRVQILRLNRRGESSAHIASVLNIPVAQVDLVLKLQRQTDEATVVART